MGKLTYFHYTLFIILQKKGKVSAFITPISKISCNFAVRIRIYDQNRYN